MFDLIKKHGLNVAPIIVENKWSAGKVVKFNEYTNGIPLELLVIRDTIEEAVTEAVKLAIEYEKK